MSHHANPAHQKAFYQRQKDAGLIKISVWVPKIKKEEFREAYDKLANRWRKLDIFK
jgi:hypothetical protein